MARPGDVLHNPAMGTTLLMPDTYLAGAPAWLQDGLFGGLAALARLLGRSAYVEPQRIG